MDIVKPSKTTKYPTSVNLKELTMIGEEFHFSRKSGELNHTLRDLVQESDYEVEIHLKPIGNAFEVSGHITTEMKLPCSRCGRDMKAPIHDQFNELIVVLEERPRAGHSGHTGGHQNEEGGPYCNYLNHYQFDLAEFAHEHIAAAEPYTPRCLRSDCEEFFLKAQSDLSSETSPENPFTILKKIPLKDQRS